MHKTPSCILSWAVLAACAGSGGDERPAPTLDYGTAPQLLRVGEAVALAGLSVAGADFAAAPPLPAGLVLDPATGAVAGVPTAASSLQEHEVTGRVGEQAVRAMLQLAIGPALPSEVGSLEAGFGITRFAPLTQAPGKFALAPDGSLFVAERSSGVIRRLDPSGALQSTPFATVTVTTGSHRGLLGLVLSPDFAVDRRVFALATVPAGGGKPERSVLYRWTDVGGLGQGRVELLDDLPVAQINNGGALCFDASGMLVVSIGDVEVPALAQSGGSYAGKLLRLDPTDGTAASGNPAAGDRILCRGLRNVWALGVEPASGALFAADNGPANDDELLLVQPGRNFEWGAPPGSQFGAETGLVLRLWSDVVVPTGLVFPAAASATDWPTDHRDSLYLALYDEEIVLRLVVSGALRTEIDREATFLAFTPNGTDHKPVDLQRAADGSLWLLTFTSIYRIDRIR